MDTIKSKEIVLEMAEKCSVRDVLAQLYRIHANHFREIYDPKTKRLMNNVQVLLNGRMIMYLDGLDTPVNDGDTVFLLLPMAGG
jgi:molybdopterin converting factor small subunit